MHIDLFYSLKCCDEEFDMVFDRDDDMLCDDTIYYLYPLRSLGRPSRFGAELSVIFESERYFLRRIRFMNNLTFF